MHPCDDLLSPGSRPEITKLGDEILRDNGDFRRRRAIRRLRAIGHGFSSVRRPQEWRCLLCIELLKLTHDRSDMLETSKRLRSSRAPRWRVNTPEELLEKRSWRKRSPTTRINAAIETSAVPILLSTVSCCKQVNKKKKEVFKREVHDTVTGTSLSLTSYHRPL